MTGRNCCNRITLRIILESVTDVQCDARPTVTFPAAKRLCPLAGTKLYCLGAQWCEQFAPVELLRSRAPTGSSNPPPLRRVSDAQPVAPPHHSACSVAPEKKRLDENAKSIVA